MAESKEEIANKMLLEAVEEMCLCVELFKHTVTYKNTIAYKNPAKSILEEFLGKIDAEPEGDFKSLVLNSKVLSYFKYLKDLEE